MTLKSLNQEMLPVDPSELRGDPHHLAPLLREVINFVRPQRILDATAGSGITGQVADERVIPCVVTDLHEPEGPVDLFERSEVETYDLVVYHPDMWLSRPDATHPHDLGAAMDWDDYVELNLGAIDHLTGLLRNGGRMLVIGNITRRNGRIHDLSRALMELLPDASEPVIVHPHPQSRSRGNMYGHKFVPIAHDPCLLWTKEELLGVAPLEAALRGNE